MYRRAIRRKQRINGGAVAPQPAPLRAAWPPLSSLARVPSREPLVIGAANDPAERAADAAAERVMGTGTATVPAIAGASSGGTVRREAAGGSAGGATAAGPRARNALSGLGAGAPLPAAERAFFEPRFGADLSTIRVHADGAGAAASRAIAARAFTLGTDIGFAAGEYRPGTSEGRHLLAHEIAHVMQDRGGAVVRRKLLVENPAAKIANPTGKGLDQTNAKTGEDYLQKLCAAGGITVDTASGIVSAATADFCPKPYPADFVGPPAPSPADLSSTPTGCGCLCDIINSTRNYIIRIDDGDWPHTELPTAVRMPILGTLMWGTDDTVVTTPSPNSDKIWGAASKSGKEMPIDPWLVLGHELCGHAWLSEKGLPDSNDNRGEGGHQETVGRENLLRDEHGLENRGGFKDPYCGESFWKDKAAPGTTNWSSSLERCRLWREKTYGKKYKISDKIP